MYGALHLSESPAVIMASPFAFQIVAPYANTAIGYLIVVPALLAFLELTRGGLRVAIPWLPGAVSPLASSAFSDLR